MKKVILSFLMVSAVSGAASAKVSVLCEKKRDKLISSVCGKSTSEGKKNECISFYKSAACATVGLHEDANNE